MERLPGFRDFYPDPLPQPELGSANARQYIFSKWRETCRRYGFNEYDGPPLEPLELFTTKSGAEIVGQLYNFTDKGGREIALRPEMTPTLARMFSAHERAYKKPVKWFAIPQLFRYERAQKGRLREHFQLNADILGEADPAADAELLALLIDTLRSFGLTEKDFKVRLSSREAWHDYFVANGGKPESEYEFYQAVDKFERDAPEESQAKLSRIGFTREAVAAFIAQSEPTPKLKVVLDNLAARGLAGYVKLDYQIIRGLAYYTGVVFEAFDCQGELRAIAGGGRYDSLLKLVSGGKVNLPALGFGMGDVVLLELLKARGLLPKFGAALDVFCLIEDESLRTETLSLVQELRQAGLAVEFPLTPTKADRQFKRAQELGAARTLRLEKNESGNVCARARELATRTEQVLQRQEVLNSCPRGLSR